MLKAARFVLVPTLIAWQVCAAQTASTAQPKGSVSGAVTSAAGEPLKNAKLTLQEQAMGRLSTAQPQAYSASTDAQGNFAFEDLAPGRYVLSSERAGYLRANYTVSSNGPITPLDLTSGQALTGIVIKMTPQALISGTVTDEDGDPYPNARITL